MLSDRAQESADSRILEHFTINDLDSPSLQQYRQRFSSLKPTHPWLGENDLALLTKLGGWRASRASGEQGLTVAGMLMFGKEDAIRESLPQYHVDYREKLSDDPNIRWTDRLTMDGTWAGNLFQFYVRVIGRLSADVKLPFQLDRDFFRKGETIVHEAIRETLVNSLIHADYQGMGGIVIEKYNNRFEFSNPGSLLISFDQLLRGNLSECRNKAIQNMFTIIGAAEKAGSGIDKIRRGWNSQHWRLPIVKEWMQPDRVQWILPMISIIPEESLIRLKARYGDKFNKFSQLEIQALVTADLEEAVDNARMRQITNGHTSDMTQLLQGLVSKKALTQEGQGRWTRYFLYPKCDSVHMKNDSVHVEDFLEAQWPILLQIAQPVRANRHFPPKDMEQIILKLCKDRWLTRKQLSELVGRNPDGLRSRFLTQMVNHGLLQLRYPEKPNRGDQAYTAKIAD